VRRSGDAASADRRSAATEYWADLDWTKTLALRARSFAAGKNAGLQDDLT